MLDILAGIYSFKLLKYPAASARCTYLEMTPMDKLRHEPICRTDNFASYLRRRISFNLIIDTFLVDMVAPDGQWLDKGAQVTDIAGTCKKGDAGSDGR